MGVELLNGKSFLITGATGCLGSLMTCRLEDLGAKVLPLITPGYPDLPKRSLWKAKKQPIKLSSEKCLGMLYPIDFVINFHWNTDRKIPFSNQLFFELSENINRLDFLWTWILHNTSAKFINISSINVYSDLNYEAIKDSTEPKPLSPYGIAKVCAENYFDAFFYNSTFQNLHMRLCSIVTNGEHPSHLMTQLYESAFNSKSITINIHHSSYLMHVDEAIDYIISASIKKSSGKLNLVDNRYSNEDLAYKFCQYTGKKLNAVFEDQMKGLHDRLFISSIESLNAGWIRKITIEEMISRFINSNLII